MHQGLAVLRLPAPLFWAMTPAELAFMSGAGLSRSAAYPSPGDLLTLMRAFPDGDDDGR